MWTWARPSLGAAKQRRLTARRLHRSHWFGGSTTWLITGTLAACCTVIPAGIHRKRRDAVPRRGGALRAMPRRCAAPRWGTTRAVGCTVAPRRVRALLPDWSAAAARDGRMATD